MEGVPPEPHKKGAWESPNLLQPGVIDLGSTLMGFVLASAHEIIEIHKAQQGQFSRLPTSRL